MTRIYQKLRALFSFVSVNILFSEKISRRHMHAGLQKILRRAGWRHDGDQWVVGDRVFGIVVEEVPGSWDRTLAPFLAKAILQARALGFPEAVAVLKVKRATPLADERLARFVAEVAPEQQWILMDDEGQFFPHVSRMPSLGREASLQFRPRSPALARPRGSLFTDLHQWMLKVLLAPFLEERLLSAPRGRPIRNASTLAEVAKVSVPAASRFLHALEDDAQLERRFGDLRISRPLELLGRWRDQLGHPARLEVGVVAVRGFDLDTLVRSSLALRSTERPPLVLALHSACEALGLGHVKGALPVLWASSVDPAFLRERGLVADPKGRIDVVVRTPRFPESLYRGLVSPSGLPVADVIQCWLDSSHYRLRGEEQADFIWRTILSKAFDA